MSIFSKKKTNTTIKQVNIPTFENEVDNLTKSFASFSKELKTKAKDADALREAKEAEIAILQAECKELTTISNYALHIAAKLDNILY